ncbi:hypothetical protein LZ32DRAFT_600574, partial [Colletotrichum eremochloae]
MQNKASSMLAYQLSTSSSPELALLKKLAIVLSLKALQKSSSKDRIDELQRFANSVSALTAVKCALSTGYLVLAFTKHMT